MRIATISDKHEQQHSWLVKFMQHVQRRRGQLGFALRCLEITYSNIDGAMSISPHCQTPSELVELKYMPSVDGQFCRMGAIPITFLQRLFVFIISYI